SDIVFATILLALIWPLLLALAIGVRMTSPGPALFRPRRYGLDGEAIYVYKFRTMLVCEDGKAVTQAQRNDPRVTPFGGLLRRTSLDELPQLFNGPHRTPRRVRPHPY